MFLTGIPTAILVASLTGITCKLLGMEPRTAKPVILLAALVGFGLGAVIPATLPYFLTPIQNTP